MAKHKRSAKKQHSDEPAETAVNGAVLPSEQKNTTPVVVSTIDTFATDPSKITIDKDKAYRLAYRLIMARANRMTVYEAKTIVEGVFGVPWQEIRQYVDDNPR
jgi:hypothetical protein